MTLCSTQLDVMQSSLGGNARTIIIANVSPSAVCGQETLSTLRFARQTKFIRNDAKVNWTVQVNGPCSSARGVAPPVA